MVEEEEEYSSSGLRMPTLQQHEFTKQLA